MQNHNKFNLSSLQNEQIQYRTKHNLCIWIVLVKNKENKWGEWGGMNHKYGDYGIWEMGNPNMGEMGFGGVVVSEGAKDGTISVEGGLGVFTAQKNEWKKREKVT